MTILRQKIQTEIANKILLNPDLMINFISFVTEEISMVELERIYSKFSKSKPAQIINLEN